MLEELYLDHVAVPRSATRKKSTAAAPPFSEQSFSYHRLDGTAILPSARSWPFSQAPIAALKLMSLGWRLNSGMRLRSASACCHCPHFSPALLSEAHNSLAYIQIQSLMGRSPLLAVMTSRAPHLEPSFPDPLGLQPSPTSHVGVSKNLGPCL